MDCQTLTDIAASSQMVCRRFVTYSNESKVQRPECASRVLEKKGAVSEATVRAMAAGALRRTKSADCGRSDRYCGTRWRGSRQTGLEQSGWHGPRVAAAQYESVRS